MIEHLAEDNYLKIYMKYKGTGESPDSFHLWSAIYSLSVAMGRRTWIDMSLYTVFPNLYVVIVGDAGLQRKSTAIDIAANICRKLEPRPNLVDQKLTPEALVDCLRTFETDVNTQIIAKPKAEGYLICDELKNFINRTTYEHGLGPMLTAFFDCKDEFSYRTKKDGKQMLSNVLLGILGGSTLSFLREALPEESIGGGVTSRIIFVSSDVIPEGVAAPYMERSLLPTLLNHLKRVTMSVTGAFNFSRDAWNYYLDQYTKFRKSPLWKDQYTAGYASRRWVLTMKVAMSLSVADRYDAVISLEHLIMADMLLAEQEKRLPGILRTLTSSEHGRTTEWVLNLIRSGMSARDELLRVVSSKISSQELDFHLDTLEQASHIDKIFAGSTPIYRPRRATGGD